MTENIIELLHIGGYSCVIAKGTEVRTFHQRGVADLYDLLEEDPSFMKGAHVADKVIGKAAAALMVLGCVENVYTDTISEPALALLQDARIDVRYIKKVPHIVNRDKTGWCPLESACFEIKSVKDIYPVIRNFISKIRINKKVACALFSGFLLSTNLQAQLREGTTDIARTDTIKEVVVTGTRNETDVRHLPMTVSVVNREAIEKRFEPSLLPILTERIPGLFITSRGVMGYGVSTGSAGGMSLRGIGGSSNTELLVLIDGHPQYMGLMGHPIADAYQTMLAERVEVVRGPASVLYGSNAMGGVINIITRKQREDAVKTNARVSYGSYNTLITEASNSMKRGRFTSIVTGSYNRTDGHRPDMEFEQYGGYAKVGYELSDAWNLSCDVNVTHFNASNPGKTNAPLIDNDSRITRGMTSFALANRYEKTSGALSFFYNWGRHEINDGYSEGKEPLTYRFNSKDLMLGGSLYQSATLFEGNRITVGVDFQHFGGEAWNHFVTDGHEEGISDKSENEVAGYADFRQTFFSWLTLDAGVRVDHHSVTGTEWIPQVGLSAYLPNNSSVKAMVSKGFRNPTIRELYMFRVANADLLPERMWNYEISYSQHLMKNRLHYGINLFYIDGDNIITQETVDGRRMNVNTGKVENWGAEADMNYRINTAWNISTNYSWLRMIHPLVAAPEHKLYIGADFSRGRWTASSGVQYVAGLYTTTEKKENFVPWNARASYRLCPFAHIFVKGENLLAQRYEINDGFPMPKATFTGGINLNF
ncbi:MULTISPECIES: TonB-dependent receptor domain-containing protein [Butyricimonas]|uniref:TonB-dependent receptor domain-containing protein n=1 Tax=Butyricimonas TaxID=574697 RepID=UPI0007FB2110|nr:MULTISPECIES: TonB-dependent receptor [Butyricimonas]